MTPRQALLRHPVAVAAGAASALVLVAFNVAALALGLEAPWLLGAVMIADLAVIGVTILVAAREVLRARGEAEDASERARLRLQESEARLAAVIESAMDAILTADEAQRIVLFNRAAEEVFRCPREQALGAPLERFIPPRFREAHRGHIERFARTGATSRRMGQAPAPALWALRADGEEFPIEASISQVALEGRRYFTAIVRDITPQMQAHRALEQRERELSALSAQLAEAREEEKQRIARELHDELGQLLTALKMDVAWMRERLPAASDLAERAGHMNALLDQTVSASRRIASELRPHLLDELGLADAALWLVEETAQRSGIRIEMRRTGNGDLAALDGSVATAVYRALQESLTNVARHSGARNAWVLLGFDGAAVHVEVEDDGRGIARGDLAKARSLGLRGMRERIAHLGGEIDVARAPRGGTRVRVRVPLG
jgi:PAS domain S-box-containing protein